MRYLIMIFLVFIFNASIIRDVTIKASDSYSVDAFGRWRTSDQETIFDSKNVFNDPDLVDSNSENQPFYFDNQQISGSGTKTAYLHGKASQILVVSNATAGRRIRQTRMWFNYQPGKSQLIKMTFVMHGQKNGNIKREGPFNDSNGVFLMDSALKYYLCIRSSASGSIAQNCIAQEDWNIDGFGHDSNPKNPSGDSIDFSKVQLMIIDWGWLGVATVRVGFFINKNYIYAHEFTHANTNTTVYMSTPNLPLRSEIQNLGTGPADTLTQICSSVESEGGSQESGVIRSHSTQGTHIDMNTEDVAYTAFVLKLKPSYFGATVKQLEAWVQLQTATSKAERFFVYNPDSIAGTLTYTDVKRSAIKIANGTSTNIVYGGYRIGGIGALETGNNSTGAANTSEGSILNAIRLGSNIAGVSDSIVFCVRPISGSTNIDIEAGISWREIL